MELELQGRDPFKPGPKDPLPEVRPELPTQPGPEPPPTAEEPLPQQPPLITPQPPDPPQTGDTGPAGQVIVKLTALDRCWLEVFVDGEHRLRTNVPRDETLVYTGKEIRLEQVGREWALLLTLGGQNLGLLQDLVPSLGKGPLSYDFEGTRVRVNLGQRYQGDGLAQHLGRMLVTEGVISEEQLSMALQSREIKKGRKGPAGQGTGE